MDIWIPMALPTLEILTPYMRPGALVVCDHVISGAKDYADYLSVVRADPEDDGEFTSVTILGQGGTEIFMKLRSCFRWHLPAVGHERISSAVGTVRFVRGSFMVMDIFVAGDPPCRSRITRGDDLFLEARNSKLVEVLRPSFHSVNDEHVTVIEDECHEFK